MLLEFVFEVFLAHALLSGRQCRRSPAQRDHDLFAERQAGRDVPLRAHQRDLIRIARQAIEIRTEMAGEGFQLVQRLALLEGFGIQLDGRERGVAAGALAASLGMLRMGAESVPRKNFGLPLVAASSRASGAGCA